MTDGTQNEDKPLDLRYPPIVEAILDIDCDMRPDFDFTEAADSVQAVFEDSYPVRESRRFTEHQIKHEGEAEPQVSISSGVDAIQFFSEDKKQLVQLRQQGFSFNRLAPYTSLDDYLAEMRRTWTLFVEVVTPLVVRAIRLRYINRILLPIENDSLKLDDYLALGPRTPEGSRLSLSNFMSRNSVVDSETGHQATIILASQQPEAAHLPVVFDIMSCDGSPPDSLEWTDIEPRVQSLRGLKNHLFEGTLTAACMELFQ